MLSAYGLIPVCRGVYIHYFKINPPHFLLSPLFWKLSQLSGQDQRNGKHTVDYHPSPSQLISKIHPLIFLRTPKGFISSKSLFNLFFFLHSSWTAFIFSWVERGQDYGVEKITKIKPMRVVVTSFDKFDHLFNLYTFGLCFVVQ